MLKRIHIKKFYVLLLALILVITGIILNQIHGQLFSSGQYAVGFFASGQFAAGIFAAGQFSIGIFSIGMFSIGIFSLGIFNIGIYSVGLFLLFKKGAKKHSSIDILKSGNVGFRSKLSILVLLLSVLSISLQAQVPNGDFEEWDDYSTYLVPAGFLTPNALTQDTFYAVTRSEDHPDNSSGSYSARIESRPGLLPNANAYGIIFQNLESDFMVGPKPSFALNGHPTSLTGYFKFTGEAGDTMEVIMQVYKDGQTVGIGQFLSGDTVSEWTPFTLELSTYEEADSASLLISSYRAQGPPPTFKPLGNSVLYIDDILLKGDPAPVGQTVSSPQVIVYPNPSKGTVEVTAQDQITRLSIVNVNGIEVLNESYASEHISVNLEGFSSGIYYIKIETERGSLVRKIVLLN